MADSDIIQNMISQLGQSQDNRSPPELDPHFVDVDERSGADLLAQARALAYNLNYYQQSPDAPSGDWSGFFPPVEPIACKDAAFMAKAVDALSKQDRIALEKLAQDDPSTMGLLNKLAGNDLAALEKLLNRDDGQVPPHLGLFAAFLLLYRYPQQAINTITGRHLDFQFRDVLRFVPKPAQPDHAHLLLELKKEVAPFAVTQDLLFSAGKDNSGIELLYRPVRETVVGHGKVDALHSVFHNSDGIFFAPIANSSDGLGGALDAALPKWRAFGGPGLPPTQIGSPPAHIGFALSSPVLRMQEGSRGVQLDLSLSGLDSKIHTAAKMSAAFEAYLTGPKGWLGPLGSSGSQLTADMLTLNFSIDPAAPAVMDYDQSVHGHAFAAQAPVLQLLLKPETGLRYDDLDALALKSAQLSVTVDGLQNLTLENDEGSLNPKKAFLPFGAQPVKGSRFMIGCEEALSKNLDNIEIRISWLGAPDDLATRYAGYADAAQMNNGVSASLSYQDRGGRNNPVTVSVMDRVPAGMTKLNPNSPQQRTLQENKTDWRLSAFFSAGSLMSRLLGRRMAMTHLGGYRHDSIPNPPARDGYITIALIEDFLHSNYRKESVQHVLNHDTTVLNEPYTPKAQSISLYYKARSDKVNIDTNSQDDFANPDLQFFHIGCFGQRREHAYLRQKYDYVPDKSITLLPDYADEGELLIGVSGVNAGDSLSMLLQVAEDSADPDLPPMPITWSVLCDNYWRKLTPQELVLDTSDNLRTSGIVYAVLPQETSTENSWMPTGRVWLRAGIAANSAAACQLLRVAANAIEVCLADQGNDPAHLSNALAAGTIAKLKTPRAEVKTLSQPYASFGAHPQETDGMLTRRAAERLRHRNRCITPWDYERMLLEAFPKVHKVKCIPHASEKSWLAPGNVMLVVVPDLRNRNAVDQLKPRVNIDTLVRMQDFAQQHTGGQVAIKVRNPRYQSVLLDFKVRFYPDYPFNYYHQQLQQALIRALAPWAYDKTRDIEFGGRIYRSVLLDFVEELPYVDFVTDFKMKLVASDGTPLQDVAEISADTPDAIIVSSPSHKIDEYTDA